MFDFMVGLAGHVRGVVPHLIPVGVTHLQYAEDTMILIEPTKLGIANLKLLLLSFENMSGLKINFNKSEAIAVGTTGQDWVRFANLLNCKLGKFPISYMGLPVSEGPSVLQTRTF
jgi:hypothetical protein